MGVLQANPACQAVLSSSEERLEMHLHLLLLSSLSGALKSSVGPCGALRQDTGCRPKGCAETELIKPAGHELNLRKQILL